MLSDDKKAEEYLKKNKICNNENWEVGGKYCYTLCKQSYLDGLAEGRKETEKQWHDCFLSCSSPYCAGHFPSVKMQGELGNMSKGE